MLKNKSILFLFSMLMLLLYGNAAMAQNTYPPFYEAPKESYVKAMKQVFEDIRSRKWDKAFKDYTKVEDRSVAAQAKNPEYENTQMDALYPLPQVAMAVIFSTENTMIASMPMDYDKAYTMLKHALTFHEKDRLNSFLFDPDVNVNLDMLQDKIEKQICLKATAANTEEAYDAVIDTLLPRSLRFQEMKMMREDLVFGIINKKPTEAECVRFLEKYPDAMAFHRTAISHSLDSLRYTSLDGSIASLEKYLKAYPSSSYALKAKDALETMEYQSVKNNVASCRNFLAKYPSSRYTSELNKRILEYAYKEAIMEGTAEAYQRYCKEFPYDLHYQEVFDSLLARTAIAIYDTVLANKIPDREKVLSSFFFEAVKKREAAEKKMIESSLVPPRRRELWTGLMRQSEVQEVLNGGYACPFNLIEIKGFDILSKTAATVHIHLSGPAAASGEKPQTDIDLFFIFEGNQLKLDDIRLDGGNASQKQALAG